MLQSRSSSSWAESLTDCVYIYTHSRAYIMHWMPTQWDAFFMLLRTHCDSRWLAYLVHVSDGWMHPSPLSLSCSRKCSFRALDICARNWSATGAKGLRHQTHSRICFETLLGLCFCWEDQVLSGTLLELHCARLNYSLDLARIHLNYLLLQTAEELLTKFFVGS